MLNKRFPKKAFTLAEVLITLTIIGMVATVVIPDLTTKYQKIQTVTALQKSYSNLSQVISMSSVDNGPPSSWDFAMASDVAGRTAFVEKYLLPYLKVTKNCGLVSYSNACVNSPKKDLAGNLSGSNSGYFVYLNDGTSLMMDGSSTYNMAPIFIDLNANKQPNKTGIDIFEVGIYTWYAKPNTLNFRGANSDRATLISTASYACNQSSATAPGENCGALIQLDGWRIADDYPWD